MKEFKHLDFPRLREYYTKYPQGYTLYESILDILEHINEMTDVVNLTLNQWEQIETWVLNELKNYSIEQLQTWLDDGTLEQIINEALLNLDSRLSQVETQLSQITTHPMKYGAVADGVTDDTISFQTALDEVTEGGVVDLEGKHYAIQGVKINKKLHLKNGKITLLNESVDSALEVVNTVTGAKISDLEIVIDNNEVVGDNVSGIFINGATDTTIQNVTVKGSKNVDYGLPYMHSSIYAHNANKVTIINCVVEDSHKEGIMTRHSNDVYIYQCKSYNCGYSGIGTSGGERAIVENCYSTGCGTSSITVNSKDSIITGCMVKDNNSENGITIGHNHEEEQYAENCVVTNNRIINANKNGIAVTFPLDCVIADNVINSCSEDGLSISVRVGSTPNISVSGNTINDCSNGARVYGNSIMNLLFDGNIIETCETYSIYINVYGSITVNNNIIKNSGGSLLSGYSGGSTIYDNLESLVFSNNQYVNIPTTAFSIFNTKDVKIKDNLFNNINTTSNQHASCINVIASFGGANGLIPNVEIDGNTLIGGLSGRPFVAFSKDLSDVSVKEFIITNNILKDIPNTSLLLNYDVNNIVTLWNNKIGLDKKNVTVTLPTGQTSLTISNSNWHGQNIKPIIKPLNAQFYNAKPFISSISNANITISYTDTGSNVDVEVTYL